MGFFGRRGCALLLQLSRQRLQLLRAHGAAQLLHPPLQVLLGLGSRGFGLLYVLLKLIALLSVLVLRAEIMQAEWDKLPKKNNF